MAYKYIMYRNKKYRTSRSNLSAYGILGASPNVTGSTINGVPNITEFDIPGNVTKIESRAFSGNKYIRYVKIPKSVTSIDRELFKGCASLPTFGFETQQK